MKKPNTVDCEFCRFGDCRHPLAPQPGPISWRAWPVCILERNKDPRIACTLRYPIGAKSQLRPVVPPRRP